MKARANISARRPLATKLSAECRSSSPLNGERAGVRGGNDKALAKCGVARRYHLSPLTPLPVEGRGGPEARVVIRWFAAAMMLALSSTAFAQTRPYIGYVYPAGGQQGATFQIKFGGQGLDDVSDVLVTGSGVSAKIVEYYRRLNPQEMQLLNEQMRELKKSTSAVATASAQKKAAEEMIQRIEKRQREYVQQPACASISSLVFADVTITKNAEPGARELRLVTTKGISNPLVFHVGELPEHTRKAMITATIQVLGKEVSALRKRPPEEAEARVTIPCTVNGQIASGEVNRYRFTARRGQRLVISTEARALIPFIADAVPGWFQPIVSIHDASGKELAFADDHYFSPDPVLHWQPAQDGEYVLAITDAIYRGREDFVYRVSISEASGGKPEGRATLSSARRGEALENPMRLSDSRRGEDTAALPASADLPQKQEREPNNTVAFAQFATVPIVINGRIDKPGDSDVFQFTGKSNDTVVAEVTARRLDSPLDSLLKLTDAEGKVIAFSDDREDLGAGLNTHHADSWLMATLPADGTYCVHLSDTARKGGEEYAYRLRLSRPRPDFELRVVPSSISLRTNSTASVTVYAQRKEGLARSITLMLTNAPPGFSADPVKLPLGQTYARLTIRGPKTPTKTAVNLTIVGTSPVGDKQIIREAVPAEDRMQAFLWRQLVPATELKALVFDPGYELKPKRPAPFRPSAIAVTNTAVTTTNATAGTNLVANVKPKFTRNQIVRRLRELKLLYEEGLLTEAFYNQKADECEALQ